MYGCQIDPDGTSLGKKTDNVAGEMVLRSANLGQSRDLERSMAER